MLAFLALLGAPYIYGISSLRVKHITHETEICHNPQHTVVQEREKNLTAP